ncbi:Laminin subunit beta-1 (Laminin B1 chain) (Laminin-1 subunit beta) (Laminin-10 subunit beta) (Laminin-12 subunit beta) (Laminin-2 subunit beta) (Laminin-6 subunit beta) (Laminin-8 subunit beta), partial [Durusdinium trenchii]
ADSSRGMEEVATSVQAGDESIAQIQQALQNDVKRLEDEESEIKASVADLRSSVSAEASARQVACEQLQKELKEDVLLKAELAQQVSEDLRGALRDEANEREELRSRLEQHVSHTREALDEMKLRFEKREAELADRVREAEEAQREELRSSKAKQLGIEEGLDELRRALAAEGSERRNAFEGIVARLQHLEASVGDEGVAREEEQRQVLRELSSALAKLQEEKADREEAIAKITQSMAEQAALLEDSLDKEAKAREASVAQAVVHLQKDLKTEGATREEMLRSTATKLQQLSSELQQEREDRSRFLRDVNASLAKLQRMQAEAAEADTRAQENDRLVVALEPQEATPSSAATVDAFEVDTAADGVGAELVSCIIGSIRSRSSSLTLEVLDAGDEVVTKPIQDLVAIDGWHLKTLVTRGLPAGRLALLRNV